MILFLGSGVSVPTGLPRVGEILDDVLWGKWHKHTDGLFYPEHAAAVLGDPTESIQRFVRYLKGHVDAAHAIRGLSPANYEDIFFITHQILGQERGSRRNTAVEAFVREIKADLTAFQLYQGHSSGYPSHLAALAEQAGQFIQCVVRHLLSPAKPLVGLDLVAQLAARAPISIVTLNHDLLAERSLDDAGVRYADGFGKADGQVRWFDQANLSAASVPRLLKLHGSINWFELSPPGKNRSDVRYAIPVGSDPWHCKTQAGEMLENWSGEPVFLTGVGNKAEFYNVGIFAEMFFRFHEALKSTDTIVMSGYGWGDREVNARLHDWWGAQANRRLVMLHEEPEKLPSPYAWHRKSLVGKKKLVEIRKWMKDVGSLAEIDAATAP